MKAANWLFEESFWSQKKLVVCGVDEVGRGAWAGPVVAAAVVFPAFVKFPEPLFDSKLLTPQKRSQLAEMIRSKASLIGIGEIPVKVINKDGIGKATQMAFKKALTTLGSDIDQILVDAFFVKNLKKNNQLPIVKGDQISSSIAAASIIAKTYRDKLMTNWHERFPAYRFDLHKGYGTKLHQDMIRQYGFSELHRRSFNLDYLINEPR